MATAMIAATVSAMLTPTAHSGASPAAYSVGIATTAVGGMNARTHSSVLAPPAIENDTM